MDSLPTCRQREYSGKESILAKTDLQISSCKIIKRRQLMPEKAANAGEENKLELL